MKKGKGGFTKTSNFVGILGLIFGCVALFICLISFDIAIGQLDTSYTTGASYSDQVGLDEVMGVWGMILFLVFMSVGLAAIAGGAVYQVMRTVRGGWLEVFMGVVMGAVAIVIALIMNDLIITQLHTSQVTVNATTNVASFSGLVSMQTIFGMIIFITVISSGISSLVASGVGAYKNIKSV